MSDTDPAEVPEATEVEQQPAPTQWYLHGEPIGPMTAELLRRPDLGSQIAGVASLHLGRALQQWLDRSTRPVR